MPSRAAVPSTSRRFSTLAGRVKLTSRVQTVSLPAPACSTTGAALERVGAGAAVQDVPAVEPNERVVAAAPDQQVMVVVSRDGVAAGGRRIEKFAGDVHEDGIAAGLVVAVVL